MFTLCYVKQFLLFKKYKQSIMYIFAQWLSCAQLFATPWTVSMDYSLPGSSMHGIFLARILEWVAISYSRGCSQSKDPTCVSCTGRQILGSPKIVT